MKTLTTLLVTMLLLFGSTGCVFSSNIETDRDRVASVALTYESVLSGLVTARQSGLIDDAAYRRIDPAIETAGELVRLLKARVDLGNEVSDDALDRADSLLDTLLEVLTLYAAPQSRIDRVYGIKQMLTEAREG